MKPTAVYIATTEGPAAIQRITAEDPDVRSVVCLAGKAVALPISGDYDAFVRRPTGVVEACFGHGAYRVDISAPIASGLSWQLGIFVAHALADDRRLTGPADRASQVVWATGEVTRDLMVETVRDVGLKIRRSEALFRSLLDRQAAVFILVPAPDMEEAASALTSLFGDAAQAFRCIPAETACGALSAVGLRSRKAKRWLPRTLSDGGRRRTLSRAALYAVSTALSLAAVVTGWSRLNAPPLPSVAKATGARLVPAVFTVPSAQRLSVVAMETRPAAGRGCAEVLFNLTPPQTIQRATSQAAKPVATADLCDFRYRVTNKAGQALSLWVVATRDGGSRGGFRLRPLHAARSLPAGATVELDARPPHRLSAPLQQKFLLFAARSGEATAATALDRLLSRAGKARSAAELTAVVADARRLGASVDVVSQQFTP